MNRIPKQSLAGAWCLVFVGALAGCAGPPVSEDEVRREVALALEAQAEAWNVWDLDAFLATYEEDLLFASSGRLLRGRHRLEQRYRENYGEEGRGVLSFSDLEVILLGPKSALALGRYHLDNAGARSRGQFSLVMRDGPEGWKILHDHTSAEPAPDGP